MSATDKTTAGRELVITRVFDAPRKLIWETFTQAKHLENWFGPRGFTTTVKEWDVRPGGKSRFIMHGPDGKDYPSRGVFKEVESMCKYVTTDEFDEGFEKVYSGELPSGIIQTVLFEDEGQKTKVTIRIMHDTVESRRKHEEMGVVGGWNSCLDCLEEYLASLSA